MRTSKAVRLAHRGADSEMAVQLHAPPRPAKSLGIGESVFVIVAEELVAKDLRFAQVGVCS